MPSNHLELINNVSEYIDISEKIVSYLDMEYLEKIHKRRCEERDSIKKRRWRRGKNSYDSLKFDEIGR